MARWLTIEEEACIIIVPEFDAEPHAQPLTGKKRLELAGTDCPCRPRVVSGDGTGAYKKPLIIHNCFRDEAAIQTAMKAIVF